jgi:hypothetical protein
VLVSSIATNEQHVPLIVGVVWLLFAGCYSLPCSCLYFVNPQDSVVSSSSRSVTIPIPCAGTNFRFKGWKYHKSIDERKISETSNVCSGRGRGEGGEGGQIEVARCVGSYLVRSSDRLKSTIMVVVSVATNDTAASFPLHVYDLDLKPLSSHRLGRV